MWTVCLLHSNEMMVTLQLASLLLCISGLGKSEYLDHALQQGDIHVQESIDREDGGKPWKDIVSFLVDKPPPRVNRDARIARTVVQLATWTSIATTSTIEAIKGYPMASVISMSDGFNKEQSTGIPYFFLTRKEISPPDFDVDARISIAVTYNELPRCAPMGYDTQDPKCPRVSLTGKIMKLRAGSQEEVTAMKAVLPRHPLMQKWFGKPGWFFAKLDIEQVLVFDPKGGVKTIALEEYFKATPI